MSFDEPVRPSSEDIVYNENSVPAAKPKGRMSWSRIDCLHTCPQKYAYKYEEHLTGGRVHEYTNVYGEAKTLAYGYDFAMQFGSAIHAGLATIYDGTAFEKVHCPCENGCTFCERLHFAEGPREGFINGRWMYKCLAMFLMHYPFEPDPITEKRNPRTRENGIRLLHAYLERWKKENFEVVAVEQEFEMDFDEFIYVGVIDLIVKTQDGISPWDHKTTVFFGEMFERQFKISGQFTGYIIGTEACTGEQIISATANGLRVSANIGVDESFKRLETYRDQRDKDVWIQALHDDWDMIKRYRERGRWPRHAPTACYSYNRLCEYYILCESGPSGHVNEDLKRSNYIVNRRNEND